VQRVTIGLLILASCVALHVACVQSGPRDSGAGQIDPPVAKFGDVTITASELDKVLGSSLLQLENQLYDRKVRVLSDHILERLVEAAAQAKGMTPEEFRTAELEIGEPPEEQIEQVLRQYRQRLPPDEQEARKQVVGFLKQQAGAQRVEQLRQRLFAEAGVVILLDPPRATVPVNTHNPRRGTEGAPIVLVEYTDFQCPYCGRAQDTISALMTRYPGKVLHVFKNLPLDMHKEARGAAEAALCANDQGRFWEMHDWMFKNRSGLGQPALVSKAEELGLDVEAFKQCLEGKVHSPDIDKDMQEAGSFGITGTPGFMVNGRLMTGAQPLENFVQVFDDELRRAGIEIPAPPVEQPAPAASTAGTQN